MAYRYRHTQIGYLLLIIFGIIIASIAYQLAVRGFDWGLFAVLVFIGAVLILFSAMTVVIDENTLKVKFGPGIVIKSIPVESIESCQVVKNPWYYGWGIRITPHGILFNVSGFHAVELALKKGYGRYRIGSDVPEELLSAIKQAKGRVRSR